MKLPSGKTIFFRCISSSQIVSLLCSEQQRFHENADTTDDKDDDNRFLRAFLINAAVDPATDSETDDRRRDRDRGNLQGENREHTVVQIGDRAKMFSIRNTKQTFVRNC